MDVLLKLRVLIWVLVISLWGMLVYQYLGEEEAEKMQYVSNPYKGTPAQVAPFHPGPVSPSPTPELPPTRQPPAGAPSSPLPGVLPEPGITSAAPGGLPPAPPDQRPVAAAPPRPKTVRSEGKLHAEPKTPPGFLKRTTRHFNVWAEGAPAGDDFLEMLEALHGNLMLDLSAFSPWAREQRVSIYLFKSQDTYRQVTGRPAWSGGASNVNRRAVYLYESEELPGILAHELCHIFYDGFFLEGKTNPLWLSEGMATLVQVERGLAAPTWLRENLQKLEDGQGYAIEDLVAMNSTAGRPDAQVRLWYAQSYSVVRFLIRSQQRASFYNFSRHLRDGRPIHEALYRGYGMPYNRLKALEYAWRYDLTTNRISQLTPSVQ